MVDTLPHQIPYPRWEVTGTATEGYITINVMPSGNIDVKQDTQKTKEDDTIENSNSEESGDGVNLRTEKRNPKLDLSPRKLLCQIRIKLTKSCVLPDERSDDVPPEGSLCVPIKTPRGWEMSGGSACKPVACALCGLMFTSDVNLRKHLDEEHVEQAVTCMYCPEKFVDQEARNKHTTELHEGGHYKCPKCDKSFGKRKNMRLHLSTQHDTGPTKCPECGLGVKGIRGLRQHMRKHEVKSLFQCDKCDKEFMYEDKLKKHKKKFHSDKKPLDEPLPCPWCGKLFKVPIDMKEHMVCVHGAKGDYACDICGKEFAKKHRVKVHKQSHSDERPYQCAKCGATYKRKVELDQHMDWHSGELKYMCIICGKKCKTKRYLYKHMVVHREIRNYHCKVCGKSFKTLQVLKRHEEIHSNERKHKCTVCGKGFNHSGSLVHHKKTHVPQRAMTAESHNENNHAQTETNCTDLQMNLPTHVSEIDQRSRDIVDQYRMWGPPVDPKLYTGGVYQT